MSTRRRGSLTIAVVLTAGVIGLLGAAPAGAVTLGETFDPSGPDGGNCGGGYTQVQSGSPGGSYAAPFAGVITSWSFFAPSAPPSMKFKVARPLGGNDFRIVGESESKSPLANTLNTYTDISIAVEAGDVIGFYLSANAACLRHRDGYAIHYIAGDASPGTQATFEIDLGNSLQFDISATLEPDCDQDGLGDETQDPELSLGACGKGNRTLTLDANKNKVKKGKRVTLSGRLAPTVRQGPCESGQTVLLQRKKPSQATFSTVEQLQTDTGGFFSAKEKLKKTFEFRAQVVETATCTSALSNTEKVKVKKKT